MARRPAPSDQVREPSEASESRRLLIQRDQPEPYGMWLHITCGVLLLALVLVLTWCYA